MPKPVIGPCGGVGQPPCPPEPATTQKPKGDDGPIKEPKAKK